LLDTAENQQLNTVLEELGHSCRFKQPVKERKLRFFEHITRVDNLCTATILNGRIDGITRSRGTRPRRRLVDDVREWTGSDIPECIQAAADRSK